MLRTFVLLGIFCFLGCKTDQVTQKSIIDLLGDTSLQQFQKRGGNAEFKLEDGILTGYSKKGTPNTFLCTKNLYKDFILDFEVLIDPKLNSGVQIRSDSVSVKGRESVAGLQVEIDPSARAWSGGIYEENRRGWIHSLAHNEKARTAFKNAAWNRYHIEAIGNSIRVWVNDVNTTNLLDSVAHAGFIGFQVHDIGNEDLAGTKVQWKNIRLITRDFDAHRKTIHDSDPEINLLPNALSERELKEGWKILNDKIDGKEKLKNKIVLGNTNNDFELKLEYKIHKREAATIEYAQDKNGKSFLKYALLDDNNRPHIKEDSHKSGSLFGKISAQNLSNPERAKPVRLYNQWSQVHIIFKDGIVQHWLNNSLVLEYDLKDVGKPRQQKRISFKNLGGGAYVRSVKIRD